MTDLITRCPGCSCSFNVSPAQLKSANGQVRCGSCQEIFDAISHVFAKQVFTDKGLEEQPIDSDDVLIYDDMPVNSDEQLAAPKDVEAAQTESVHQAAPARKAQLYQDEHAERFATLAPESLLVEPALVSEAAISPKGNPYILLPIILLLLLAIVLQYAHFNAPALAESPAMQPYIEKLCDVTQCSVFARDIEQLQIANLQVASIRGATGGLRISGRLTNKAGFQQLLPDIEVRFDNLHGALVAQRIFKPAEYLPKRMNAKKILPKKRSVLFTVDIVDPGEAAQSYSFVLH